MAKSPAFRVPRPGEVMFKLLYDYWQGGGVLHVDAAVSLVCHGGIEATRRWA